MSNEAITWALAQPIAHSSAKFVLVVLADHANEGTWEAYPSTQSLVESTCQDRKTVVSNLARLRSLGLIEDTGKRIGKTRQVPVYRLLQHVRLDAEKRNSSENGTVPKTDSNSAVFPSEQSRFSLRTVPETGHGTLREPSRNPKSNPKTDGRRTEDDRFPEFWTAYPRKEGKAKAEKVWKTQKLDKLADEIVADVLARVADPKHWDVVQFIPHPTTYLNQRRWEDEWPRAAAPAVQPGMLLRESEERAAEINARAFERLGITL